MEYPVYYKSKLEVFDRIILAITFLLFPIGLIMAVIRVLSTHYQNRCKGRNHNLLGWTLTYVYVIMMGITYLTYDSFGAEEFEDFIEYAFAFGVVFMLPAICFFVLANRADKKFNDLLYSYTHIVMDKRINQIGHIAVEVRQSPEHVIRDLEFMIQDHRLPYGTIQNGILFMDPESFQNFESPYEDEEYDEDEYDEYDEDDEDYEDDEEDGERGSQQRQPAGPVSVECPGCGSRIVLNPNEKKECEYCGNMIVA